MTALESTVCDLTAQGMAQIEIARRCQVAKSTVWRIQKLHGVSASHQTQAVRRGTEAALQLGYSTLDTALVELAREHSNEHIARMLNVDPATMLNWLRARCITPQPAKRGPKRHDAQQIPTMVEAPRTPRPELPREYVTAWVDAVPLDLVKLDVPDEFRMLPAERWCARCGETMTGDECLCCDCRETVDAASVLRPGEYVVR